MALPMILKIPRMAFKNSRSKDMLRSRITFSPLTRAQAYREPRELVGHAVASTFASARQQHRIRSVRCQPAAPYRRSKRGQPVREAFTRVPLRRADAPMGRA